MNPRVSSEIFNGYRFLMDPPRHVWPLEKITAVETHCSINGERSRIIWVKLEKINKGYFKLLLSKHFQYNILKNVDIHFSVIILSYYLLH